MAWFYLVVAGAFEIVWAFTLKQSEGFARLTPTAVTISAMIVSLGFLSAALRTLPLGTAYAIWTGIGAVGAFCIGIVFLGEAMTLLRVASAGLILAGLVGLKLSAT